MVGITIGNTTEFKTSTTPPGIPPSNSFSHTAASGGVGTRQLVAIFEFFEPGLTPFLNSESFNVTYGGNALTLVGSIGSTHTVNQTLVEIWRLVNPPTGVNTLAYSLAISVPDSHAVHLVDLLSTDGGAGFLFGGGDAATLVKLDTDQFSGNPGRLLLAGVAQEGGSDPYTPTSPAVELFDGNTGAAADDLSFWVGHQTITPTHPAANNQNIEATATAAGDFVMGALRVDPFDLMISPDPAEAGAEAVFDRNKVVAAPAEAGAEAITPDLGLTTVAADGDADAVPPSSLTGTALELLKAEAATEALTPTLKVIGSGDVLWPAAKLLTSVTRGTLVTNAALPPGDWTVMIKAVDTSDNYSENAAAFDIKIKNENELIESRTEGPRWPGARTGLIRHDVSGALLPASTKAAAELSVGELFTRFCPFPAPQGTYEAAEIDVGFDADDLRVWADMEARSGPGLLASVSPELEIDYRDEAGSYDGFEPWTVGFLDARRIKARVMLDFADGAAYLVQFAPTVDVPLRTEARTVTVPIGGETVTFSRTYHRVPEIQASAKRAAGGAARFAIWDSPTTANVLVQVVDSAGTDVGGTATVTITGP